jgi:hypothetical protein
VSLRNPDAALNSAKLPQDAEQAGVAVDWIRPFTGQAAPPILAGGETIPDTPDRIRDRNVVPIIDSALERMIETVFAHLPGQTS